MKQLKIGNEVRITIRDHAHHSATDDGDLVFHVYGKVLGIHKEFYVLGSWCYQTNEVDQNVECFTIARGAIKKVRVYK